MIPEEGLLLNIHKPIGWTSFRVVQYIRRLLPNQKVGHSGTLDPFASGVLLICVGKATRKTAQLMELEKEYFGIVSLDFETDTLDITGKIVAKSTIKANPKDVRTVLKEFIGEIDQVPPIYSALKLKGTPYYKLARRGIAVEPKKRRVKIENIELIDYDWPNLTLLITCSKGTYIRSLARDIGHKIGCRAHLRSLKRTRIGCYRIEDALRIEELTDLASLRVNKTDDANILEPKRH